MSNHNYSTIYRTMLFRLLFLLMTKDMYKQYFMKNFENSNPISEKMYFLSYVTSSSKSI